MIFKKTPQPPPDTQGGPESMLPGQRSGQGSQDLFKHIERDIRRKAGLPGKKRPEQKPPAPEEKKPEDEGPPPAP